MEQSRISAAAAVMVLLLLSAGITACGSADGPGYVGTPEPGTSEAETTFYSALENAAKQQRIRVSMYRETFATEADAKARKGVGTIASSVSEVDTGKRFFRSVFVNNLLRDNGFTIGRCQDKTTYIEHYERPSNRPTTLGVAAARAYPAPRGDLHAVTEPLVFISCPRLGLMPGGTNIAMSRLSDGLFPVTLSDSQAANWAAALRDAKLFTIRDEGTETRNGTTLRRISFTPKKDDYTVNAKLFAIFQTAGEIDKIKREQPKAEVAYEFVSINPVNTGGVGGFYLIDEARKLPVYSELYGTNPDKPAQPVTRASKFNIARTKQNYSYPEGLTMTTESPLEYLE